MTIPMELRLMIFERLAHYDVTCVIGKCSFNGYVWDFPTRSWGGEDVQEEPLEEEKSEQAQKREPAVEGLYKFSISSKTVHRRICKAALAHKRTLESMIQVAGFAADDLRCKFCFP